MNRRELLRAVATAGVASLAGCGGTEPGMPTAPPRGRSGDTASQADDFPGFMLTPADGECVPGTPPNPTTGPGLPDTRSYPENPDPTDREAVRSFLEDYEAAFLYNRRLAELAREGACVEYLDTFVTDSTIEAVENGFAGRVTTRGSYTGAECPDGEAGTPLGHRDYGYRAGHYRVSDRFLVRESDALRCWG